MGILKIVNPNENIQMLMQGIYNMKWKILLVLLLLLLLLIQTEQI